MITELSDNLSSGPTDVARRIRNFVRNARLAPGDRLPTHQALGQRLHIGPRRLREGLSILEQQGLIRTNRKAGTILAEPSVETLTDPIRYHLDLLGHTFAHLVRARAGLEKAAAEDAARNRTARDLLAILDAIERMEDLTRQGRCDNRPDEDFHHAILGATHNPVMLVFGQLVAAQFRKKIHERLKLSIPRQVVGIREHRSILRAVEQRDVPAAGTLMYQHVIYQLRVIKKGTASS